MQKLILIVLFPLFSALWSPDGGDINKMLKEAQKLEQQRKYKSAAELALKLEKLAREKNNDIVYVQALEIEIKAQRWFDYETFHMALKRIDKALEKPFGRTEILLRTFKISGYNQYYNRNSYQLQNNLNDGILNEEPKQWSKHDIWKLTDIELKKILKLKSNQTLNEEEVKSFSFSKKIDGVQPLNLTDLAILSAIHNIKSYDGDYPYKSDELYFILSDFIQSFNEYNLDHPTEIIAAYYALLLQNQDQKSLLADHLNLNRLRDLFKLDNQYDKLKKYEKSLLRFTQKESVIRTSAAVELAEIYIGYASRANASDNYEEAVMWQKKALQLCEEALKIYPDSDGAQSCKIFINRIKNPALRVSLQTYLIDGKPIPVRIAYKNTEWVKLKLYRITAMDFAKNQRYRGLLMQRELPIVWEEKIDLPQYQGYFQHDLVALLPKVEKGFYVLRTETDKQSEKLSESYEVINVTQIAIVTSPGDDATNYQLVHRNSGRNLENGMAQIVRINYDYRTKQQKITYDSPMEMKSGKLIIDRKTRGNLLQFTRNGDTLLARFNYNVNYNRPEKERMNVQFITDRAIYRPGQVVYFKAILTNLKGDEYKPVTNEKLEVFLHGADYKNMAKRVLTTNKFGSVNGSFLIPESARPGQFRLRTNYGTSYFEVQFYKRPSFEAEFIAGEKLTKPGEEVGLDLQVSSFAGSSIQNAVVETTVKIGSGYFRFWPGFNQSQVVDYTKDTTNNKGIAHIRFQTLQGKTSQYYTITSKVTLPDGASNEFNYSYYVTSNPLNIDMRNWPFLNGNKKSEVAVKGINGERVNENILLKVKLLDYPDDFFYEMPFSSAEKILADKAIWETQFPGMAYNDNLDPKKMDAIKTVYEVSSQNGTFVFNDNFKLKEGWYAFEFYAGDTLNQTFYKKYSDSDYKKIKVPNSLIVQVDKTKLKPGETLKITLVSNFEDARIRLLVNDKNGILKEGIYEIDGKKQQVEIPLEASSEGRISISAVLIAAGRAFIDETSVEVIPVSRKINIEFTSIRDEIAPGEDETWSLQLTKQGKPVEEAEIVASMYDMSLDMFISHNWNLPYAQIQFKRMMLYASGFVNGAINQARDIERIYDEPANWYLNSPFTSDFRGDYRRRPMIEGAKGIEKRAEDMDFALDEEEEQEQEQNELVRDKFNDDHKPAEAKQVAVRTNFNETAFFYPTLNSNNEGKADIQFSVPQSMTKWKLQVFAHDKNMASGYAKYEVVTQKPLMVIPNRLRFVHQGDRIAIKAMVYNLTDSVIQVQPDIKITNPYNGERINASIKMRSINVEANGNGSFIVGFDVPYGLNALTYQIAGKSGAYSDGELHNIPVLPSRQRIINTLAIWNKPGETKKYKFASLEQLNNETSEDHELTIEVSTNPVWYAIKALPAVFESNNKSAIQLARNFQVTAWSHHLIQSNPEIQRVFKVWDQSQPEALKSALKKNLNLRKILLGETPWEEIAENEELQHAALMEMLNENFVQNQFNESIRMLKEQQMANGAFSWRPGMQASYYFTLQTVIQLAQTAELPEFNDSDVQSIMTKALNYLKIEVGNQYYKLIYHKVDTTNYITSSGIMYYLLAQKRLNKNYKVSSEAEKFYLNHAYRYTNMNLYRLVLSGMLAKEFGHEKYALLVLDRLQERATIDNKKGMFWRQNQYGWNWDEAPVQTQAMIAEFYDHMKQPDGVLDAIKLWLVHEKQGQAWRNADASLAAARTIISTGSDWVNAKSSVEIKIDGLTIKSKEEIQETGTGYFSKKISKLNEQMSDIEVINKSKTPVWGGFYHSYTEDYEHIKSWTDELSVERQIFIRNATDKGVKYVPFDAKNDYLKVGAQIRVQLIIKSDRALDYVWVNSPNGAGFEPENQKSGYRWEAGKSFYIESRDSEKRFFFDYLNNGSIVVSYDLYVERVGEFNVGPVEIQSVYAPEFSAHTSGIKLNVKE